MSTLEFETVEGRTVMRGPDLYQEAVLVLLPTIHSWEAPAYLWFGGFNACPFPEVHVSMARWAHGHYGARIVAMSRDTIEWQCLSPPRTRENSLRLARDLRIYAEEITLEAKNLGRLASALKNGSVWSCWWD